MAGTQAPKGFGIAFVLIGIPLILWSAKGTNQEIAALDTKEARQASCMKKIAHLPLVQDESEGLCRCVVREAEQRGIKSNYGGYDKDAITPVINQCFADYIEHETPA